MVQDVWSRLADLELSVDGVSLEGLRQSSGSWVRRTTVVTLTGGGESGAGEDVIYDVEAQLAFQQAEFDPAPLRGRYPLGEFSHRLDRVDLYPVVPADHAHRLYRRWAFESAALALALRQAGTRLAECVGRAPGDLRYVVSMGLGSPPTLAPLHAVLERYPDARFKLDLAPAWDRALLAELAALGRVDVVDFKGQYRGAYQGPPADAEKYALVAELLPEAWLEDPEWNAETAAALQPFLARVTWDANLHAVADLLALPVEPRCVNAKPSRFGFLAELFRFYAYCEARGIGLYGGGQFELGVGRDHIQALAALFHPDACNDVAPVGFNRAPLAPDLPPSPLRGCSFR